MNTQITTPANGKPNGAVVNGATTKPSITDEALIALAISKGHTAANVSAMKLVATNDEIAAKYAAMPSVNAPAAPLTIEQELAMLRAENEALKRKATGKGNVSFKMSVAGVNAKGQETKGGMLCVYGLQKFPFSFSQNAIIALFGNPLKPEDNGRIAEIKAFAKANWSLFRTKE